MAKAMIEVLEMYNGRYMSKKEIEREKKKIKAAQQKEEKKEYIEKCIKRCARLKFSKRQTREIANIFWEIKQETEANYEKMLQITSRPHVSKRVN
jgi:hypothetical protein